MVFFKKTAIILAVCSSLLMLSACSAKAPKLHKLAELPDPNVCRLAVLPFSMESGMEEGNMIFYRVFLAEIASMDNFEIIQEGDVRKVYRQLKLLPFVMTPDLVQLQVIGNYLNVQYLVLGKVLDMGIAGAEESNLPYITVEIRLVDAASGKTLWSTYHSRRGEEYRKVMHFGLINSTTSISRAVSQEILDRWRSEGFTAQCTE